jgi:hypothetical protein
MISNKPGVDQLGALVIENSRDSLSTLMKQFRRFHDQSRFPGSEEPANHYK